VLSVFVRAFRTPDLRKKLLFTGATIVLFRFGSNLPAPGISEQNVSYCSRMSSSSGVFAILNLLSGNSLLHLTVFAIGILPYITASIIVQMLTQVIPRLETLRKDGPAGQAKITQYTSMFRWGWAWCTRWCTCRRPGRARRFRAAAAARRSTR
jgi:preprotein translocase subunit SecY